MDKPIDYIISYCDYSDDDVRDLYENVTGLEYNSNVNSNYIDITLTLKLILKNLNFINKVYLVCKDVQVLPDSTIKLINESSGRIIRVNESEFMPNGYITFSSACIELFMWRIPGLSEYFIYGNDDMIPMKPLFKEYFFKDGKPRASFNWKKCPNNCLYDLHMSNATNLVYDRRSNNSDYSQVCYTQHTLRPLTKSLCEECYCKYERFIMGSLHTVRYFNNMNMDLYLMYGLKNELVFDEKLPYKFCFRSVGDDELNNWLKSVLGGKMNYLNDVECINDAWWVTQEMVSETKSLLEDLMTKILEQQ